MDERIEVHGVRVRVDHLKALAETVWYCACGWHGTSGKLVGNASGCLCCADCGASGGLVSEACVPLSRLAPPANKDTPNV